MSETWQVFRIEELDTISFECPTCHTDVSFKATNGIANQDDRLCPGCNKTIPDAGRILSAFHKFFQESARVAKSVNIRLRAKSQ
ncbi:MAG: hypothetical protein ABI833_11400 [Acidobacteriota bacterium]